MTMADLKDLQYRFFQAPIEMLFNEIGTKALPHIDVPEDLSNELDMHLQSAITYCTCYWQDSSIKLYRARRNDYEQFYKFPRKKMGPPKHAEASEGRAQPAGLAFLYLANEVDTAVAEIKPEIGEYITVGHFRLKKKKPLKLLDLSRLSTSVKTKAIDLFNLSRLSRHAFSAPAHSKDPNKYKAQAYFVQKIRALNYDGIGYESATRQGGRCFAFFDSNKFRCTHTQLRQVKSITVLSEPTNFSEAEKAYIDGLKTQKKSKEN